jgi:hypothetical protein
VTNSAAQEIYPAWSPDGDMLAVYDATVEGGVFRGPFLLRRPHSGSWGAPRPLRGLRAACPPPVPCRISWAPNGRFVAYAHGGAVTTVVVSSGVSRNVYTPMQPLDPRAEFVSIADDSTTLYFKSHDSEGRAAVWSVPASGGRPIMHIRFDDLSRPSMRPEFAVGDGRFFFTIDDRRSTLWVADVASLWSESRPPHR